jgi:hypothetical protein
MITTLKIASATLVIVGVVAGFLDLLYAPHYLMLHSSPKRPAWLRWLVWAVASSSAILYIVLDYLQSQSRAFQREGSPRDVRLNEL